MQEHRLAKSRSHAHFLEFAIVMNLRSIDHYWVPID